MNRKKNNIDELIRALSLTYIGAHSPYADSLRTCGHERPLVWLGVKKAQAQLEQGVWQEKSSGAMIRPP